MTYTNLHSPEDGKKKETAGDDASDAKQFNSAKKYYQDAYNIYKECSVMHPELQADANRVQAKLNKLA
jgi:hypothetical protein